MASDYKKETPNYVRGVLTDSIIQCLTFCHYCGERVDLIRNGFHIYCNKCGHTSEGCGD